MNSELIKEKQKIPDDFFSEIEKDPILKITKTLSSKGYMSDSVILKLEKISSIEDIDKKRKEYKLFLEKVEEKISEADADQDEESDEVYI